MPLMARCLVACRSVLLLMVCSAALSHAIPLDEKTSEEAVKYSESNGTAPDPQEDITGDQLLALIETAALDVAAPLSRRVLTAIDGADTAGRRRPSPWDSAAPALMIGGTLAALLLAAVKALAGKALLASILAAAVSAMQLARPPPPPRRGR